MTMRISTFTPKLGPGAMTIIKPDKKFSILETYSNVAYFSWGSTIVGKQISMNWNWMDGADFNVLVTIVNNDTVVNFNPDSGVGQTYNVVPLQVNGDYMIGADNTTASIRTNVQLDILITSTSTVAT